MASNVKINHHGIAEILNSHEVGAMLESKLRPALAKAKADAPVRTGEYRDGLHIEMVHTDRIVARILGGTDHDWIVEAETGNLKRALDAAG